ncbi:MAG: ABC transporter permease [Deltaproteobacteria bacterium]|nr:ABC transporter permease [Deltaproteobacteria bacterium]
MKKKSLYDWGLRLSVFALAVGAWELFLGTSQNFLLPSFVEILGAFFHLLTTEARFWDALYISNQALLLGYAVSLLIGIPLGLLAGRLRWSDRIFNPYVGVVLAMPIAPLIPIVIIALGLGLAARVFIVVSFAFVFIMVNTRAGVRAVDAALIEMAKSFGAKEGQIWRRIVIPGALPAIFAGMRIGLGRAITGMVMVELLLVATGLGRLLLEYSGRMQSDLVFATIAAVVVEALALLTAMQKVERRVARWAPDISIG